MIEDAPNQYHIEIPRQKQHFHGNPKHYLFKIYLKYQATPVLRSILQEKLAEVGARYTRLKKLEYQYKLAKNGKYCHGNFTEKAIEKGLEKANKDVETVISEVEKVVEKAPVEPQRRKVDREMER